jgi:hypothetical protein
MSLEVIALNGGPEPAVIFKRKAKRFFGVGNLDGMPDADQVKKMNAFWRHVLDPIPGTISIRAWLENINSVDEYITLFHKNWCKDVIKTGALR